jgi:hypothetical protein
MAQFGRDLDTTYFRKISVAATSTGWLRRREGYDNYTFGGQQPRPAIPAAAPRDESDSLGFEEVDNTLVGMTARYAEHPQEIDPGDAAHH